MQIQSPGVLDVWASGQTTAQNFNPNQPIEVVGAGGLTIPADTTQWPLAIPYGAVAGQTLAALYAGIAASPSQAPLLPLVQTSLMVMCLEELLELYPVTMHLMAAQCQQQLILLQPF